MFCIRFFSYLLYICNLKAWKNTEILFIWVNEMKSLIMSSMLNKIQKEKQWYIMHFFQILLIYRSTSSSINALSVQINLLTALYVKHSTAWESIFFKLNEFSSELTFIVVQRLLFLNLKIKETKSLKSLIELKKDITVNKM